MRKKVTVLKTTNLLGLAYTQPLLTIGQGQPRILLVAGLHGNEPSTLVILAEFLKNLPRFQGTLQIIAPANPLGLSQRIREMPLDKSDLNRSFVGKGQGTSSERTAKAIEQLIPGCSAVIDLHSFNFPCLLMAVKIWAGTAAAHRGSDKLAHAFAPDAIWQIGQGQKRDYRDDSLQYFTLKKNIPVLEIEFPPLFHLSSQIISRSITGLQNVLKTLTKRQKESTARFHKPIPIYLEEKICAFRAGIFRPAVSCGQEIKKGQTLGYIFSLETLKNIALKTSRAGVILGCRSQEPVSEGDEICSLGRKIKEV